MSRGLSWGDEMYARFLEGRRRAQDAPSSQSEEQLLQSVRALLTRYGFLHYHTRDSRRSDAGFPDVVATDGRRLVAIECKSATGKLTVAQTRWLALLEHTGTVTCLVIRPGTIGVLETWLRTGQKACG